MNEIESVNDAKEIVQFLQKKVRYVRVLSFLPPVSDSVKIKSGLSLFQNVKAHIVKVVVSQIDFNRNKSP